MELKNTIEQDCKYWEKLNGNGFCNYMHLQECENSSESGLYQLILNGVELWYGTLAEINAVVKTMILRDEMDDTDKNNAEKSLIEFGLNLAPSEEFKETLRQAIKVEQHRKKFIETTLLLESEE